MPDIFLDVSRLLLRNIKGQHSTGIDRVGLAYIAHYRDRANAVLGGTGLPVVLARRDSARVFDLLLEAQSTTQPRQRHQLSYAGLCVLFVRGLLNRTPDFLRRRLKRAANVPHAVLLHTSHTGMEHLASYRAMRRRGIQPLFMVHDLIPLTHAEYSRAGVDALHRQRIHTALRHASGLIANSQDTLDALRHEATRAGLPMPPCVVAHLASGISSTRMGNDVRVDVPLRPSHPVSSSKNGDKSQGETSANTLPHSPALIEHPYFVMLGTIEPRKNHWLILHVWRRLVEQLGAAAPRLVIIGRRGWECENVVDMLERCATIQPAIIEEADCSDARLRVWLAHARALLFPSFVEGYGIPLVEALALGVPVLASDLGVFHEIVGNIPDYLDPLDGPGWLARIRDYAQDASSARAAQLVRLGQFRAPTWQEHFARVDAFLETLFTDSTTTVIRA